MGSMEITKSEAFKKFTRPDVFGETLLLTHNDMDAAGAEIVARKAFKNLTVKNCGNNEMSSDIVTAVLDNLAEHKYNTIIVCDISCNEDDAVVVNDNLGNTNLVLLDHHDTALHLNKYDWALVKSEIITDSFRTSYYCNMNNNDNAHSSGTSLLYDFCDHFDLLGDYKNNEMLQTIVHTIATYDTWDWINFESSHYDKLDKICDIYGIQRFVKVYSDKIDNNNAVLIDEQEELLLEIEQEKIDSFREHIKKSFIVADLELDNKIYSMVMCFTGQYLQEAFDVMKTEYPGKDLYIINYGSGISFRTCNENMHLGKFVKEHFTNGGGHAGAAGFKVEFENKIDYMEKCLHGKIINIIDNYN